jgi:hypothetical protein
MLRSRASRPITPSHARAFVEARLGRSPRDALEAAVVLEAWGGIRSERALELGELLVADVERRTTPEDRCRIDPPPPAPLRFLDHVGLVVIVAVVALVSDACAAQLDGRAVSIAWKVALPISLALQWTLRRRHLTERTRLGTMRKGAVAMTVAVTLIATILPLLLGESGVMAAMLVVVWVGAMIVALRGWALAFGAVLALAATTLGGAIPALSALGGLAAATLVLCAVGIASAPVDPGEPAPWRKVVPAGAVGAGFGLILVSDRTVGWGVEGALPVLAYLPSFVGGLWASVHARTIWQAVPHAARETSIGGDERRSLTDPPGVVLAGATVRLAAVVLPLSALLVGWTVRVEGQADAAIGILTGFAIVALASVLVGILDACNETTWALAAVGLGCIGALAARSLPDATLPAGGTLMIGGAIAVVTATPPIVQMIRRPGRKLATTLFIP